MVVDFRNGCYCVVEMLGRERFKKGIWWSIDSDPGESSSQMKETKQNKSDRLRSRCCQNEPKWGGRKRQNRR